MLSQKIAEVDKRKLLQQHRIDSLSIVSEMLTHPLNFKRLRNTGFEGYVLSGKTVNSKYVEKGVCPEPNESQALLMAEKEVVCLLPELSTLTPCGTGQPEHLGTRC